MVVKYQKEIANGIVQKEGMSQNTLSNFGHMCSGEQTDWLHHGLIWKFERSKN